jgi:cytidyltransferase-like protein
MSYENGYGPYRAGGIIRGWQAMGCRVVCASGYFDPVHKGHVRYLSAAKKLGDRLVVIVNNGYQTILKKGRPFMPELDRLASSRRCGASTGPSWPSTSTAPSPTPSPCSGPTSSPTAGTWARRNDCRERDVCRNHNIAA